MAFAWHDHHFINRHPALDLANTVVYRHLPARRDDRITDIKAVEAWHHASGFKLGSNSASALGTILEVREILDGFFRHVSVHGDPDSQLWAKLVRHYARHASAASLKASPAGLSLSGEKKARKNMDFIAAILHCAIELAFSSELLKVKVCPGCGWLFIDRTRNGQKRWCISAMCGNRSKARRHYEKKRRLRH